MEPRIRAVSQGERDHSARDAEIIASLTRPRCKSAWVVAAGVAAQIMLALAFR